MSGSDDFVSGLKEQYGEPGHDNSHPMAPWGGGVLQKGLELGVKGVEYGGAFARGAMKQALNAPGLRAIEPQALADYGKEVDPAHPDVEGAGRYVTPANVMIGGAPDLALLSAAKTAPWAIRTSSKIAQNAWKSTLGGAAQADTDTPSGDEVGRRVERGAAEGLGTGVAVTGVQGVLRALPRWAVPALMTVAHGHYLPFHVRHALSETLLAIAARAAKIPAGLTGAIGEAAAQQTGFEPGGKQQEQQADPF